VEKNWFAETEFKRLYWQGYQGRFGLFRWPTTDQTLTYLTAFDNSENHAWASATGLLNLITNLNAKYPGNVYLTAHSQGTVVVGNDSEDFHFKRLSVLYCPFSRPTIIGHLGLSAQFQNQLIQVNPKSI